MTRLGTLSQKGNYNDAKVLDGVAVRDWDWLNEKIAHSVIVGSTCRRRNRRNVMKVDVAVVNDESVKCTV